MNGDKEGGNNASDLNHVLTEWDPEVEDMRLSNNVKPFTPNWIDIVNKTYRARQKHEKFLFMENGKATLLKQTPDRRNGIIGRSKRGSRACSIFIFASV
ncbi:hypothetical protein C1646_754577 [Rhizophagus diaphanus]|nr:hypothetical protein C1646_754577 [Rhizophagus diaphanus] [Rhizophagus sp. MUCL 43196]